MKIIRKSNKKKSPEQKNEINNDFFQQKNGIKKGEKSKKTKQNIVQ